jgi:GR25 family glycosyltransferase involved in LPS biosynthesis
MKSIDIPIFIVHYKKLADRKKYLDAVLRKEGFVNIHWFEDNDRNTMTQDQLNMYKYDSDMWYKQTAIWHHYDSVPRKLSLPEIACEVTHIEIYKYICDNDIKIALFFEDDCIIGNNFAKNLGRVVEELPDDFDACYLSDCFGWTVDSYKQGFLGSLNKNKYTPDKCVYKMGVGKCADSFLLSNKCAKKLYENFIPFCLPPDWTQSYVYLSNNMNIYWAEPALTHQGSETVYQSSIRSEVKTIIENDEKEKNEKEKSEKNKKNEKEKNESENEKNEKKKESFENILKYREIKGEIKSTEFAKLENESKERLLEFTRRLILGNNFTIVKFGDGEFRNMISDNENEHNCDGCNYFKKLGIELIQAYIFFLKDKNTYINRWHSHVYNIQFAMENDNLGEFDPKRKFLFYDLLVQKLINNTSNSQRTFKEEQITFFRSIKHINRIKVYITNEKMIRALVPILNINYGVAIPEVNSYNNKKQILENIHKLLEDLHTNKNIIFLFSCGMFSKVLISILLDKYPDNTYLDIGSTFDGLIKQSRDFNGTVEYQQAIIKAYS